MRAHRETLSKEKEALIEKQLKIRIDTMEQRERDEDYKKASDPTHPGKKALDEPYPNKFKDDAPAPTEPKEETKSGLPKDDPKAVVDAALVPKGP